MYIHLRSARLRVKIRLSRGRGGGLEFKVHVLKLLLSKFCFEYRHIKPIKPILTLQTRHCRVVRNALI